MRKLLLSLLAVAGFSTLASAETFTITDLNIKDKFTLSADKKTATFELTATDGTKFPCEVQKGSNTSNDLATALGYSPCRIYKGFNMVIKAIAADKKLETIEFTYISNYAKGFALEENGGTLSTVSNDRVQTWTAPAGGADQFLGNAKEAQVRISKIVITTAGQADPNKVAAPTFTPQAGTYYEAQNVTIAGPEGAEIHYTIDGTAPSATSAKYTAAIPVAKTTTIKAIAIKDSKTSEVATAEYVIAEAPKVASIADMIKITDEKKVYTIDCDLTIGFRNSSNIFVTDGKDFIQIYGSLPSTLVAGSKINKGWQATYKLYNGNTPELLPVSAATVTGEAASFTPKTYTGSQVSMEMVNSVITIKEVTFEAATPSTKSNFTGTADGKTLSFRNNYTKPGVEAGTYDVTVVVTIYVNKTDPANPVEELSLYIVSYEKSSGISDIAVDNQNAPVEYFDLRGVKVNEPAAGQIVIRRQGDKVTKMIVR